MDNRKFDWVIILIKGNSHAKGLQVCKKVYDDFYKVGYTYMYGDWNVDSQYVVKEWKLDSFTLLWNKLTAKYNPTLKDKVKKFFLHNDYPKEIDVRPDNNSLAIAQYNIGNAYIIEDRQSESILNRNEAHQVDPSTVCQFTGLKDCKGKEIFEHDLIHFVGRKPTGEVIWSEKDYAFMVACVNEPLYWLSDVLKIDGKIERVCNKFDKEK